MSDQTGGRGLRDLLLHIVLNRICFLADHWLRSDLYGLDASFYLLTAFAVSALFPSFGLEAKQKVGH